MQLRLTALAAAHACRPSPSPIPSSVLPQRASPLPLPPQPANPALPLGRPLQAPASRPPAPAPWLPRGSAALPEWWRPLALSQMRLDGSMVANLPQTPWGLEMAKQAPRYNDLSHRPMDDAQWMPSRQIGKTAWAEMEASGPLEP